MARNILVVEDDRNISELIRMYLEKEGFEVRLAYDGGKAVEEYDKRAPDMVLLDIMLPVILCLFVNVLILTENILCFCQTGCCIVSKLIGYIRFTKLILNTGNLSHEIIQSVFCRRSIRIKLNIHRDSVYTVQLKYIFSIGFLKLLNGFLDCFRFL